MILSTLTVWSLDICGLTVWKWFSYNLPWNSQGMTNSDVNDFCLYFLILSRAEYGEGSCFLLQSFFPTQGSNPVLRHCGWILYQLSHQESPYFLIHAAKPGYWPITFTKLFIVFFFFFLSQCPGTQTLKHLWASASSIILTATGLDQRTIKSHTMDEKITQ